MLKRLALVVVLALTPVLSGCGSRTNIVRRSGEDWLPANSACTRIELSPQERQQALHSQWFGIYADGQRAGRLQTTLSQESDGSYVYRMTEEFVTRHEDRTDRSKSTQIWSFHATPPHAVVRVEKTRVSSNDPEMRRTLQPVGNSWTLTTRKDSFEHVKLVPVVEFTLDDLLAFDVWLERGRKAGDTVTLPELDPSEGVIRPVRYHVICVSAAGYTYDELDVQGNHWRGVHEGKDNSTLELGCWRICQETESPTNDNLPGVFLNSHIKMNQQLGKVGDIDLLRLRASGPAAARLKPGPGQQIQRAADGSVTITLRSGEPALPTTPEEIAAGLEDTFDFPWRHPEVQALLRQALGDRRLSRRATVERLIEFLEGYVVYDSKADPVSVVELIRTHHGVCRHFADLLTTLLRADGIPARSVGGLACGGGAEFGGHAWVEFEDNRTGTWVGVDPTFHQLRTTAHLRFEPTDEGETLFFELPLLQLEVAEVHHEVWIGWRVLLWTAAGVAGAFFVIRIVRCMVSRSVALSR
jgi:hypothetical protein